MSTNTTTTTAGLTIVLNEKASYTITLKSFKSVKWMSEETNCFTAQILINGTVYGEASNEGHGGCTFVHYKTDVCRGFCEDLAKAAKPSDYGWDFTDSLTFDNLIDILVERQIEKKETARIVAKIRRDAAKKAQYIKTTTQKGFVAGFKGVTDLNREKAVAQAKAHPDFKTMVADMTDAEIAAWFIA